MADFVRGDARRNLAWFANALRDCLDLDPLYHDKERRPSRDTNEERFYVAPFEWPNASSKGRP